MLVEIHGQHETQGLLDPSTHRVHLDQYARLSEDLKELRTSWTEWQNAEENYKAEKLAAETARAEEDYLRQSIEDLDALSPQEDEEEESNFEDLGDEDKTGSNFAQATFDKIETQILDAFALLSNEEDKKLFEDYLITNIKLYFDKFENELDPDISEPTTDEYEDEKDNVDDEEGLEDTEGEEEELEL